MRNVLTFSTRDFFERKKNNDLPKMCITKTNANIVLINNGLLAVSHFQMSMCFHSF